MRHARLVLLLLAAPALADGQGVTPPPAQQAAAARKFESGKLTDPYWGVTYAVAGLEEKGFLQSGKLFAGKAGPVAIEIGIYEHADELDGAARRDAARKSWEEKHRDVKDATTGAEPAPWIVFVEESLSGAVRQHGYAWYVRGPRAFVVHASVPEKGEGTEAAIKAALAGLTVGPETGASVYAQVFARSDELPIEEPKVLVRAAKEYMSEAPGDPARPAIAEGLFARALAHLAGSVLERDAEAVWDAHESHGYALVALKRYDDAVRVFETAKEAAAKTQDPVLHAAGSDYDVACALSRAGKLDPAFAALDRAYEKRKPVPDDHLKSDPDLENLHGDPRWAKLLTKAAGMR